MEKKDLPLEKPYLETVHELTGEMSHVFDKAKLSADISGYASDVTIQKPPPKRTRVDLAELGDDDPGCFRKFRMFCRDTLNSSLKFVIFFKLAFHDLRTRKGMYTLSFCSVFFVVVICVAMLSILSSLPIVFLRLGETDSGEIDMVISPGGIMNSAASLNYTAMTSALSVGPDQIQLHTPRITWATRVLSMRTCDVETGARDLWYERESFGTSAQNDNLCEEGCLSDWCTSEYGTSVQLVGIDLEKESRIGLGGYFRLKSTLRKGETIISDDLAISLGARRGDKVLFFGDAVGVFREALFRVPVREEPRNNFVMLELVVVDVVAADSRKFPSDDSFALVNFTDIVELIADSLAPWLPAEDRKAVAEVTPNACATSVYFRMPPRRRSDTYVNSNFNTVRKRFINWGTEIVIRLGFNQVSVTAPILNFMRNMNYFSMFVGLIVSIVILAVAVLSVALIYSLLTVGIETRTYELGIQRMIGFTRQDLVLMVLTNAYMFTIPAWLLGLAGGQILYSIIRLVLKSLVNVTLDKLVSASSLGWASLAGLLIPLVASLFPIASLVTLRLPDALNSATRGGSAGVIYKIRRGDASELNGTMLGLGVVIAVFGFLLYYLFPLSIIASNLSLTFYIFFAVLIGMLIGLLLLATNFERMVEMYVAYIFFFWENNAVFDMILKSLAAHRLRNRKTTLMYALAIGFIVFISVAFAIQITTMKHEIMRNRGAEVSVDFREVSRGTGNEVDFRLFTSRGGNLTAKEVRRLRFGSKRIPMLDSRNGAYLPDYAALQKHLKSDFESGVITAMTYCIRQATRAPSIWNIGRIKITSLGRFAESSSGIVPLPPNFYEVLFKGYLRLHRSNEHTAAYGVTGALYATPETNSLVLATSAYKVFAFRSVSEVGVVTSSPYVLNETGRYENRMMLFTPSVVLDSSPALLMTKLPNSMGELISSIPSTMRISGLDYMSCNVLPLQRVYVRVAKPHMYDAVRRKITRFFTARSISVSTRNIDSALDDIKEASNILEIFFVVAQLMIMVVCFFSLMSSMTANVLGSSKEIGILLCMGMTHFQVYRVYIWEAFVLVISSGLLGLVVGSVVGFAIQLQNALYSQLPLTFTFPHIQLCIMLGVGALSALASSWGPVTFLLRQPSVVHILRRTIQ